MQVLHLHPPSHVDWLLVLEDDAVLRHLPRFSPKRVMFTDLISETRRSLGLPTALLTPVCDEAIAQGMDAHLFVGGAGMRFE